MRALRRRYGGARAVLYPTYEVRPVLAGAYRGQDIGDRALLTHAVGIDADNRDAPKTLCGRILSERLSDENVGGVPSCPVCAERLARITVGAGRLNS